MLSIIQRQQDAPSDKKYIANKTLNDEQFVSYNSLSIGINNNFNWITKYEHHSFRLYMTSIEIFLVTMLIIYIFIRG